MTVNIAGFELYALMVPILLGLLALGGLVLDMTFWRARPRAVGVFTFIGLLATIFLQLGLHFYRLVGKGQMARAFQGQYYFDAYSSFFNFLFLIAASVAVLLSLSAFKDKEGHRGEYYILIVIATIGMCLMAAAHDLMILFIGIETMSIAVYVLVGIERDSWKSSEASIKYLLVGAFASAVLLFGMALAYGATGAIDYEQVFGGVNNIIDPLHQKALSNASEAGELSLMGYLHSFAQVVEQSPRARITEYLTLIGGIMLIFTGLFFKVAAVPFHMWAPDVYEGAPTPITAYMATAVKAAAFAAMVRLVLTCFMPLWGFGSLYVVLYVLAVLTMTLGNLVAVAQTNLKRMLAYSSIAHAGYLLVGVTAMIAAGQFLFVGEVADQGQTVLRVYQGARSILFYLVIYAFMNLGAFGVISAVERVKKGGDTLEGFSGLSLRSPAMAVVMAVCMLSLTGIPPLAGFASKFYLFQAAVNVRLYLLVVIAVLNSVVSAYYYLRVIVVMYFHPESEPPGRAVPVTGAYLANILMAFFVVFLGVVPQSVLVFLEKAIELGMINLPVH